MSVVNNSLTQPSTPEDPVAYQARLSADFDWFDIPAERRAELEGKGLEVRELRGAASRRKAIAWYIPDDNGEPYKTTGYDIEAAAWRAKGLEVLPLFGQRALDSGENGQQGTSPLRKAVERLARLYDTAPRTEETIAAQSLMLPRNFVAAELRHALATHPDAKEQPSEWEQKQGYAATTDWREPAATAVPLPAGEMAGEVECPFAIALSVNAVVLANDESHAFQVAVHHCREIFGDVSSSQIEYSTPSAVRKASDLPRDWDLLCIPYGGDGNTRLSAYLEQQKEAERHCRSTS
ncbi:hypothetical protein F6X40_09380 [Paraburkholderia sp. UCT31]|uniref:hypothetical protein n=1 Tax=Paraburkholderia sp. UCT31 TaxID=2615209 RepID=UPI0016566F7E|nr:hypothetical protein [Paraburkholderia sp. UCT31]MBC8737019.1 hypothetical protein [Paraburkholderia sp. UCT31]